MSWWLGSTTIPMDRMFSYQMFVFHGRANREYLLWTVAQHYRQYKQNNPWHLPVVLLKEPGPPCKEDTCPHTPSGHMYNSNHNRWTSWRLIIAPCSLIEMVCNCHKAWLRKTVNGITSVWESRCLFWIWCQATSSSNHLVLVPNVSNHSSDHFPNPILSWLCIMQMKSCLVGLSHITECLSILVRMQDRCGNFPEKGWGHCIWSSGPKQPSMWG